MEKIKKIVFISLGPSLVVFILIVVMLSAVMQTAIGIISQSENNEGVGLMDSLPPWVTPEIILTSLQLQDQYGIYASVTIAQAQ